MGSKVKKVRFKGKTIVKSYGGCSSCKSSGNAGKYASFQSMAVYSLPSGREQMFRAGIETEVYDIDFKYLMAEEGEYFDEV